MYRQQYDAAIRAAEQAIELGPNFANAYLVLGEVLAIAGRAPEAIELTKKAMRLNPHYPAFYLHDLGLAYLLRIPVKVCQSVQRKAATESTGRWATHSRGKWATHSRESGPAVGA
jgi:tetratricopeptide (TPR) repeat protein